METKIIIFSIFSILLLAIGIIASKKAKDNSDNDYYLVNRKLNWFLIGLSAAVTGNTGFIVTGAVGIGYSMGLSSLLLPFSWLIGDLVYWNIFPKKLNRISKETKSSTISEFLSSGLKKKKPLFITTTILVLFVVFFYTSAQWVAAGKIFASFFNSSPEFGILISATLVVIYSSFGGLRSSVWTDIFQALFIIILVLLIYISIFSSNEPFITELYKIEGHMDILNYYKIFPFFGFVFGWIFASIGFSLSQPQLLIRYFAGSDEKQFNKAKWVYIFFLHFTWIGLTLFGVFLRYFLSDINPDLAESSLAIYINRTYSPIVVGILISAMFATISSTADSFLISSSNSVNNDILKYTNFKINKVVLTILIGVITVVIAFFLKNSSVLTIAMNSVNFLASIIAPVMLIKFFKLKHTSISLTFSMIFSLLSALIWMYVFKFGKYTGDTFFETLNIVVIGFIVGLITNSIVYKMNKSH